MILIVVPLIVNTALAITYCSLGLMGLTFD